MGIAIRNCKFHDIVPVIPDDQDMWNSMACGIFNSWGGGPNTFEKNIFYSIGYPGFVPNNPEGNNNWSFCIGGPALNGDRIYNNTMSGAWCGIMTWVDGTGRSVTVKNNIITNMWNYGISNGQGAAGMTESHNLFYYNYMNYQGLAAAGVADFVADPQLDTDYSLLSTSPAINAGVDVGLPAVGLPDLGAVESSYTSGPGFVAGKVTTGGWDIRYRPAQGVAGVDVHAEADNVYALTAADGSYRLPLPAGPRTIDAVYQFAAPQTADVTITANNTVTKDFVLLPEPGQTYYVAPNGDDNSADPTNPATPWRTIGRGAALSVLLPGDTVIVAPGTYPQDAAGGAVLTSGTGNLIAPVIYKCPGPGKAVIDQSGVPGGVGLNITGGLRDIVLDGFEFIGGQWGVMMEGSGPAFNGTHDNVITNCVFHGQRPPVPSGGPWESWCAGIYSSAAWNNWIYGNVFYDIGVPNAVPNNPDNNNNWSGALLAPFWINNQLFNNVMDGSWTSVQAWEDCRNNTIRNNIVTNMWGNGFRVHTGTVTNSNNLFYNNASDLAGVMTYGPGDMGGNPLFVGGGDYHIQSGSPAVNSGYDVGLPYVGPAKDIGAFESSYTTAVGTVSGRVTVDNATHAPIPGAKVGLPSGAVYAMTSPDGYYSLTLPAGSYSLQASANAFASTTRNATVPANGTLANFDFSLMPAQGTIYYVNGETGNDGNDGKSPATAWKTISNGDSTGVLLPGDIVEVAAGTYSNGNTWGVVLILNRSGNSAAPITYKANGRVIIDGTPGNGTVPHLGFHMGANYITLDGFEMQNLGRGVFLSDGRMGITVRNCVIHDIYPARAGVETDNGSTMWDSLSCGIYDSWPGGENTFHNNLIYDVGIPTLVPNCPEGNNNWAFGIGGCRVIDRVYNNTIANTWRGMQTWVGSAPSLVTAKNNIIVNCWGGGLVLDPALAYTGGYNLLWNVAEPIYGGSAVQVAGDLAADPLLDPAWKLQAGSPAIDAGVDLGFGWAFKGLAPDMGCFESDVTVTEVTSLQELKNQPLGTTVNLTTPQVVTANSSTFADGSYYIEDADRQTGIKIVPAAGAPAVAVGDRITLVGTLALDANDQKVVNLQSITSQTAGDPLGSLGIVNKSILNSAGANVAGTLVRVWGRVTYKDPAGAFIYVDDGSGLTDGGGATGVLVILDGLTTPLTKVIPDSPLPYVTVTGLAGQIKVQGLTLPAIRLRGDADITW